MCEINPRHTKILRLEFFTSHDMTPEQFENRVAHVVLEQEQLANMDGSIRCHIHETDTYADGYSLEALREHYDALMGPPGSANLTRDQLISALRGTEFDEHAYI